MIKIVAKIYLAALVCFHIKGAHTWRSRRWNSGRRSIDGAHFPIYQNLELERELPRRHSRSFTPLPILVDVTEEAHEYASFVMNPTTPEPLTTEVTDEEEEVTTVSDCHEKATTEHVLSGDLLGTSTESISEAENASNSSIPTECIETGTTESSFEGREETLETETEQEAGEENEQGEVEKQELNCNQTSILTTPACPSSPSETVTEETLLEYEGDVKEYEDQYSDETSKKKRDIRHFFDKVLKKLIGTTTTEKTPEKVEKTEQTPHDNISSDSGKHKDTKSLQRAHSNNKGRNGAENQISPRYSRRFQRSHHASRFQLKSKGKTRRDYGVPRVNQYNRRRYSKSNQRSSKECREKDCTRKERRGMRHGQGFKEWSNGENDMQRGGRMGIKTGLKHRWWRKASYNEYEPVVEMISTSSRAPPEDEITEQYDEEPTPISYDSYGNSNDLLDAQVRVGEGLQDFLRDIASPGEKRIQIVADNDDATTTPKPLHLNWKSIGD